MKCGVTKKRFAVKCGGVEREVDVRRDVVEGRVHARGVVRQRSFMVGAVASGERTSRRGVAMMVVIVVVVVIIVVVVVMGTVGSLDAFDVSVYLEGRPQLEAHARHDVLPHQQQQRLAVYLLGVVEHFMVWGCCEVWCNGGCCEVWCNGGCCEVWCKGGCCEVWCKGGGVVRCGVRGGGL